MKTITKLTKASMLPYVAYGVDDALNAVAGSAARALLDGHPNGLAHARIVGWTCGFEPMCVAVWSYLPGVTLDEDEATELAVDLLREKHWFADPDNTEPDFVL